MNSNGCKLIGLCGLAVCLLLDVACSEKEGPRIRDYPQAKAAAVCRQLFACCDAQQLPGLGLDYASELDCRQDVSAYYEDIMLEIFLAEELGELSFDDKLADEMLMALAQADCTQDMGDLGYVEKDIIIPKAQPGDTCHSILSCSESSCALETVNSHKGICQAPATLGQACRFSDDCQEALYCHLSDPQDEAGVCTTQLEQGASCTLSNQCAVPMVCLRENYCQEPLIVGEACLNHEDCQDDLYCEEGFCLAHSGIGEACWNIDDCQRRLLCEEGFCRALHDAGEACDISYQCAENLICSSVTWTCTTPCSKMASETGCNSAGRGDAISCLFVLLAGLVLEFVRRLANRKRRPAAY